MKKVITLLSAAMLSLGANAQNMHPANAAGKKSGNLSGNALESTMAKRRASTNPYAKATAITPFYTDTFSATSLSTGGWVASGNTGSAGTWKFTNKASTGSFGISKINSTTAAGGYMLYDSDSIGVLFNSAPQIGTLTSPPISCTGHTYVGVRFQQYTRRFQDTFYVQVTNNNGATWTTYPISPNMGLRSNDFTNNPEITTINVSPVAANQAAVKVRFYYSGAFVGGGYNWMIDDFQMVGLDPIDLGLSKSGQVMTLGAGTGFTPMGTMAKIFADTVVPITELYNYGGTAVSSINVGTSIYTGGASVYSKSVAYPNVPINAFDSVVDFSASGYKSTTTGTYVVPFNTTVTGDANTANNVDTTVYTISDSSLCPFMGYQESSKTLNPFFYSSNYYLHAPSGTGRPNGTSYYMGNFFEIPSGTLKDTITSVSVCLSSATTVGTQIQAEVYSFDAVGGAYNAVGRSVVKTLTAADISTSSNLVFTTLEMNIGTSKSYTIANAGSWAVVVKPVSPSTSSTILVASATSAAPVNVVGQYGVSDSSDGGIGTFGVDLPNNFNYATFADVPAVVVNFGNSKKLVGVKEIVGLTIGEAFPNPANTVLNIPVGATATTAVKVRIQNVMGQQILSQDLGTINAGQQKNAVFNTSELSAGVYLYSIEANGERITRRIVIAH